MAYKDILFAMLSYPDATPTAALRGGVDLARRLGSHVTALVLQADFPAMRNRLANALVGLDRLAEQEETRSAGIAAEAAACFTAAAADAGLSADVILERAPFYADGERVCAHARTRDVCLLPIGPAVTGDRGVAEAVLFGSGRPVVVFSESAAEAKGDGFGTVAIAWDGSARAARAVADALPALSRAREVRILVVTGEKPSVRKDAARDLTRHLKAHGIEAVVDEVAAARRPIGRVIDAYVAERSVELLVMGGFGQARVREFILGGATSHVLDTPPCPVLLSH